MRRNNLTRRVFAMLLAALLFLAGTLPASADDTQTLSDARWSNGSYSATLGRYGRPEALCLWHCGQSRRERGAGDGLSADSKDSARL